MEQPALETCPDTDQPVRRIITGGSGYHVRGGPSAQIKTNNNLRKALEKDPNHTSLSDYDPKSPNSVIGASQRKSKEKIAVKAKEAEKLRRIKQFDK